MKKITVEEMQLFLDEQLSKEILCARDTEHKVKLIYYPLKKYYVIWEEIFPIIKNTLIEALEYYNNICCYKD